MATSMTVAACGSGTDSVPGASFSSDRDASGASDRERATTDALGGPIDVPVAADGTGTTAARASAPGDDGTPAGAAEVEAGDQQVGLSAGSVDDNVEWEAYLRYRETFAALGIVVEDLPVDGRRVLRVVDGDDRPVADCRIEVRAPGFTRTLRTGSDGRAVVLAPVSDDQQGGFVIEAEVFKGDARITVELGPPGVQTIQLPDAPGTDLARLDLHFLIDATGSMSDEIERLKATMVGVAEEIGDLESAPDVRFAFTAYRDHGDDFVARTVDFTGDVDAFVTELRQLVAGGGGDTPEAFNEAFDEAVNRPSWRTDTDTVRLMILVADAPPHVGEGPSYVDTIGDAAGAGIRVFPVASSGTDDQAEYIFRQVAQATLGRFIFLSYGAGGAAVGQHSNTGEVGYDVLSLDALIVRLVEEQLAPLTG